jgi:hypothetical protein
MMAKTEVGIHSFSLQMTGGWKGPKTARKQSGFATTMETIKARLDMRLVEAGLERNEIELFITDVVGLLNRFRESNLVGIEALTSTGGSRILIASNN